MRREEVRTLAAAAARARRIAAPALDGSVAATTSRLRALGTELEGNVEELVSMGNVFTTPHGGSLRTFSGNQNHENGWFPSYKRRRNQHWEGMTQRNAVVMHEANFHTQWAQTESHRIEFSYKGRRRRYTNDLLVQPSWGQPEVWELKRDLDDLADEDYRDTLAGACEIWRRCGWGFRIVLASEVFANIHHRHNSELIASRRFAHVGPEHIGRLARHATRTGSQTTWGDLADALEPGFHAGGLAIAQALVVRRRIQINLAQRIDVDSPVTITASGKGPLR